jgi:hypothetical protein
MVKPTRKDWAWVFVISSVLILIAVIQGPPSPPKPGPPISFSTIYDQTKSMTEAQQDVYFQKIRGYNLYGAGWVEEVKNDGAYYQVNIGLLPSFPGLSARQRVVVKNTPQNIALKLNKRDKIEYSGNIIKAEKLFSTFLVVTINRPTITNFEK